MKVRVNEVDIEGLKKLLRTSKENSKLSNRQISEIINKPLTLVEHWFRTDNCFSIPEEDIWPKLRKILKIKDNSFDKQIMEFEIRDGVYEKAERCYYDYGISPTLTINSHEKIILTNDYYCLRYQRTEYAKQIRKQYEAGEIKERRCNMREYTTRDDGCCNTLTTVTKDNYIPEVQCAAMRGRYNSDGKIEQHLELGSSDYTNTLTTVSKDNYIIEVPENFQKPPTN